MADDENVFAVAALVEKPLEVVEGGFGSESVGDLDGGFVAGLGAYQRGGLHAALEIAGDDEIELYFQRIQDIRELEAVAFAVFVQWRFLSRRGLARRVPALAWRRMKRFIGLVFIVSLLK
jgi:hypothetical protein